MAPIACRSYISKLGLGDKQQCERVQHSLSEELKRLYTEERITGSRVRCLESLTDVAQIDLLEHDDLKAVPDVRFPFVWVFLNVKPSLLGDPQLAELESRFSLQVIDEYEIPH
jgi:hypothetical protein